MTLISILKIFQNYILKCEKRSYFALWVFIKWEQSIYFLEFFLKVTVVQDPLMPGRAFSSGLVPSGHVLCVSPKKYADCKGTKFLKSSIKWPSYDLLRNELWGICLIFLTITWPNFYILWQIILWISTHKMHHTNQKFWSLALKLLFLLEKIQNCEYFHSRLRKTFT